MAERKYNKNRRVLAKAGGSCSDCSNKARKNQVLCDECADKASLIRKSKRNAWKLDGKCYCCGGVRVGTKNVCEKCYFIQASVFNLGTSKLWRELVNLLVKQGNRCAVTGDMIGFHNMELDHITPTSRGGSKTLNNVRWVTKDANQSKCHLTDKEFLELCYKVIEFNKYK